MASDDCEGETSGQEPDRERERQIFAILAVYFEAAEAGEAPDRTEWLTRYPDFAEDIVRFMDDQDRLLRLTEPLRPIASASDDTVDVLAQAPTESAGGPSPRPSVPLKPIEETGQRTIPRAQRSAMSAITSCSGKSRGAGWVSSSSPVSGV